MPYYLNRLGELNIEDNNVVLNYQASGNTSNKGIGGGLTIQDGDALGNDVTTLKNIIDGYVLNDFQILKDIRLSDGKLKCLYVKS